MLTVIIDIKNFDYDGIFESLKSTEFGKEPSETVKSKGYLQKAKEFIGKKTRETIIDLMHIYYSKIKNIGNHINILKKSILLQSLNSTLSKIIPIEIEEIFMENKGDLKISVNFSNIDYFSLFKSLYTLIPGKLISDDSNDKTSKIIKKLNLYSDDLIKNILKTFTKDELEDLLSYSISLYGSDIVEILNNEVISKNGFNLTLSDIKLEKIQ